jgi:hypothetical protein
MNERTTQLAAQLVESSLADWQRVRQYESDFSSGDLDALSHVVEIDRSIHALHSQWLAEAEEVHSRVKRFSAASGSVPRMKELEDAIGFTHARLKATPEQLIDALEQVKRGEVIPAKELRDELNARLRARR